MVTSMVAAVALVTVMRLTMSERLETLIDAVVVPWAKCVPLPVTAILRLAPCGPLAGVAPVMAAFDG